MAIFKSDLKSRVVLPKSVPVLQINTTVTKIRIRSTALARIIPGGVNLLKYVAFFCLILWVPSNTPAALPFTSCYMAVIPISKTQWMCWKVAEWSSSLQIHPVPSGRLIWVKYLKSWKSLHIFLNEHTHLELMAVPLVPCKSSRNVVEVWDLLQKDWEVVNRKMEDLSDFYKSESFNVFL